MTDQPIKQFHRLSQSLMHNEVDDLIIKQIMSLDANVPPELEQSMLMALSDTRDAGLRNVLAVALANIRSHDAVPRILALLRDPKTFGCRSILLYVLQNLHVKLSLDDLIYLVLFDTPETQKNAFLELKEFAPFTDWSERSVVIGWILESLGTETDKRRSEIMFDVLELLLQEPIKDVLGSLS